MIVSSCTEWLFFHLWRKNPNTNFSCRIIRARIWWSEICASNLSLRGRGKKGSRWTGRRELLRSTAFAVDAIA